MGAEVETHGHCAFLLQYLRPFYDQVRTQEVVPACDKAIAAELAKAGLLHQGIGAVRQR